MVKRIHAWDAFSVVKPGTICADNALVDSTGIAGVISVAKNTLAICKSVAKSAISALSRECKVILGGTGIALNIILVITINALTLCVENIPQSTLAALLGAKIGTSQAVLIDAVNAHSLFKRLPYSALSALISNTSSYKNNHEKDHGCKCNTRHPFGVFCPPLFLR